MKNGPQIKADIEAFGGDIEKTTAYCIDIRNQALDSSPTVEEYQVGNIRYLKSSGFQSFPDPSDEIIGMWRDLFEKMNGDPCAPDPLTEKERKLYDILTDRLTAHFSILGLTETILDEKEPLNIPQPKPFTKK